MFITFVYIDYFLWMAMSRHDLFIGGAIFNGLMVLVS